MMSAALGGMTGVWAIEELTAAVPELAARWPIEVVMAEVRGRLEARSFLLELEGAEGEPEAVDMHRRLLAAVPEVGEAFGLTEVYGELGDLVVEARDAGDREVVARALAHVERLHVDAPSYLSAQARVAVLGREGWTAGWLALAGPRTLAAWGATA